MLLTATFLFSSHALTYFDLSFPPALLGIGIALLVLIVLQKVPKPIQVVAQPLLSHMVLFFIPAIVGIVAYVSLIIEFPLALLMAIVASTVVSLLITAWLSQKLLGKAE
jgi:holin-like protein